MAEDKHAHFLTRFSTQKRGFSYYLLGSLIVIICSFIGQFPMFFFLPSQLPTSSNPMDMFAHLDSNLTFLLLLIPSLTAFLGFLLVVYRLHDQTLVSVTTSRDAIDFKRMLFGFLFWGMLSTLIVGIDVAVHPDDFQWNFKPLSFLIMAFIACLFIPIQSGLEEWLFRGYLLQGFAMLTRSPLLSLLLTSIIFGSLHILNPEIGKLGYGLLAYYIGTGFFFGIISLLDEGIELAIGFHVANNLFTALWVTADWTAFQTESLFKDLSEPQLLPELILFLGIVYPLVLIFLGKKYGWKNKLSKLFTLIPHDKAHL